VDVLIETQADVFVTAYIEADLDTVDGWSWSIIGQPPALDEPPQIAVTPEGARLRVSYYTYDGLFPINVLRYLDPSRNPIDITSFDDLPPPALSPQIILLDAGNVSVLTWIISATATGMAEGVPAVFQTEQQIIVFNNFDISRDLLVSAVSERSGGLP